MNDLIHVAILGGTGYGAGELLRLLSQHPQARVVSVTTTSQPGQPIDAVHPHLRGFYDLRLGERVDLERVLDTRRAVVFSALPHGASAAAIDLLLAEATRLDGGAKLRVIDLSGDFRLQDAGLREQHYPETPQLPDLRASFVYGLPELFRPRIAEARFVANPGCLASAAILALAPLYGAGFQPANGGAGFQPATGGAGFQPVELTGPVAIDAVTGSSGSGRALKETTHHPTRHADFRAYSPLAHRHEPEIAEALRGAGGPPLQTSFVPHSMDAARGVFVTAHATLARESSQDALRAAYARAYEACPFVRVLDESPTLQNVVGSNFCDVSVAVRGRQVVATAALDNLVKGMAGVAIQNMNLMFGLDEKTGLWAPAFRPV